MIDLTAALHFLDASPAPMTTLIPTPIERRRFMLEDTGRALFFFADFASPDPAAQAAVEVFAFAAAVWSEYLLTYAGSFEPDQAALRLHAWSASRTLENTRVLPTPLYNLLADSFPKVGDWTKAVRVIGFLSPSDAGTAAGWWTVCTLAAMCAGPGFEDGEPEDLLDTVLSSLGTATGQDGK